MSPPPSSEHPGDRPAIPWETEPISFFHALLAGAAVPVTGEDTGAPPLLEEEPALWPTCG
ncbi:MAG: hypothetical protein ACRD0C_10465 [Acidimicrobiia bacterium]